MELRGGGDGAAAAASLPQAQDLLAQHSVPGNSRKSHDENESPVSWVLSRLC